MKLFQDIKLNKEFKETIGHTFTFSSRILIGLILIYFFSGIYSISSNEIGVLQRLGRVIDERIQPGIHYCMPWPFDQITRVPIKTVNRIDIRDFYGQKDIYCLTGDNNMINIQCIIQYTIVRPLDFLFHVKDPSGILENLASNTIIKCLSIMPIDEALTYRKQQIANDVKQNLQKQLENVQIGIDISFVELKEIKPPALVEEYFSDVVNAKIECRKMQNDAESDYNSKIPEAKAFADQMIQQAEAFKKEVVLKAEGEANRFESLLAKDHESGKNIRNMFYIETLKMIWSQVGKKEILVPGKNNEMPANIKFYNSVKNSQGGYME